MDGDKPVVLKTGFCADSAEVRVLAEMFEEIKAGNLDAVKTKLNSFPSLATKVWVDDSTTAMSCACAANQIPIIVHLIRLGHGEELLKEITFGVQPLGLLFSSLVAVGMSSDKILGDTGVFILLNLEMQINNIISKFQNEAVLLDELMTNEHVTEVYQKQLQAFKQDTSLYIQTYYQDFDTLKSISTLMPIYTRGFELLNALESLLKTVQPTLDAAIERRFALTSRSLLTAFNHSQAQTLSSAAEEEAVEAVLVAEAKTDEETILPSDAKNDAPLSPKHVIKL